MMALGKSLSPSGLRFLIYKVGDNNIFCAGENYSPIKPLLTFPQIFCKASSRQKCLVLAEVIKVFGMWEIGQQR